MAIQHWFTSGFVLVFSNSTFSGACCWTAAGFEPFGQLMHMELDRLHREVDVKFTRQDALDMRKVLRDNDESANGIEASQKDYTL